MCRWITLLSADPVSLSDVVLAPQNSLVQLSKDASFHPGYGDMNNHVMNGDGFGIGWYHSNLAICPQEEYNSGNGFVPHSHFNDHPTPMLAAVFKDIQPAWNNANLRELCLATQSRCVMAHVRAASKNTGVSQVNCHPFKAGRLLFCHNGRIDQFGRIRRDLMSLLTDEAFMQVRGTTDSECIFALLLTFLSQDGQSNVSPMLQTEPFGHKRIAQAIKKVLKAIENIMGRHGLMEEEGVYCTFNFSCTDGESMVVTRYCDQSPEVPPPSLYFAFGNAQHLYGELTSEDPAQYLERLSSSIHDKDDSDGESISNSDHGSDHFDERAVELGGRESTPGKAYADVDSASACFIVASNPLTKTHTWHRMPKNSIMWYTRGCAMPQLRLLRRRTLSIVPMKHLDSGVKMSLREINVSLEDVINESVMRDSVTAAAAATLAAAAIIVGDTNAVAFSEPPVLPPLSSSPLQTHVGTSRAPLVSALKNPHVVPTV